MPQVTVTISGARDATFTLDEELKGLLNFGGNFTAAFQTSAGTHIYAINVSGSPRDRWSATVTDGVNSDSPGGQMDDEGFDTTGDTAFEVQG